ncbi:MAG: BON domain-containing protein [Candidatus Rokuibacteriota bacterium]
MEKLGTVIASLALASLLGAPEIFAQTQPKVTEPPKQVEPKAKATQPMAKTTTPIQSTKRFSERTGLSRASTISGMSVKDATGKDAGKIEDLMVDSRGEVAYAVVSFGGFLGIGDKLFALPWDAVWVDRSNKTVYIDVNKEMLEKAPSFATDKYPDPSDREWGKDVRRTWNDASITAAVKMKLAGEKAATLVKVDVDTDQGVVQLNGAVDSERTKQRASELVRQVDGVRKVINNLKVQG